MNPSWQIDTEVFKNGIIEQTETHKAAYAGIRDTVYRYRMDTKEQQIREALIKLGWTPPKEKADE